MKIYYFSGTGNALSVSNWINNTGITYGTDIEIHNIAKLDSRIPISLPKNAMIGFISPTHGFNFPPIMLHFLLRFPK
jgi:flavodoxin